MDLAPFELIVPCGIQGARATSMTQELARPISVREVMVALIERFKVEFRVSLLPTSLPELFRSRSRVGMIESGKPAIVRGAS